MFNIAPKIIETVFSIYPDPDEADFDELATQSIIGVQSNLADLNNFLLATRGKNITDRRREITTMHIANILFYTTIIIHISGLPPDLFDMDEEAEDGVVAGTGMFDEAYFHSPLMLGNHLMGICADIGEHMWSDQFNPAIETTTIEAPSMSAATVPEIEIPDTSGYSGFMENLLKATTPEFADEDDTFYPDDEDDELLMMIDRLLAGLVIMAQLCDIDLGVCMFNASQQEGI